MTAYETIMLKLKLLELAQRQTLIAITAHGMPAFEVVAEQGLTLLEAATTEAEKLL